MGRGAGRGLGISPAQFLQISALQSSPKSTVTQLAVHDYNFLHQDHSAYSNDLTSSDLFWNLKFDNDGVRYPWWWMTRDFRVCWKSVLFNAVWRHKLQWCHIRNRLIRVPKKCTFHYVYCINCGKYCCLICQSQKLLGWPPYGRVRLMANIIMTPAYCDTVIFNSVGGTPMSGGVCIL